MKHEPVEFVVNGVKYRTKPLVGSKAARFSYFVQALLPKLYGVVGQVFSSLTAFETSDLDKDVSELPDLLKEKITGIQTGIGGLFGADMRSALSGIVEEIGHEKFLQFQAGQEPYDTCKGGILEQTEVYDLDEGKYRPLNFDEDFAGAYEDSLFVTFHVVKANYPRFFGFLTGEILTGFLGWFNQMKEAAESALTPQPISETNQTSTGSGLQPEPSQPT